MGWAGSWANSFIALVFFAVVLLGNATAIAAPLQPTQTEVVMRQLVLQRDVADLKIGTQKDTQRLEIQQHEVNTRVEDLKARIGDLTLVVSLIAPSITILAIFVGLAAYWTAGQRAHIAAEKWMDDHSDQFRKKQSDWEIEANAVQDALVARVEAGIAELDKALEAARCTIGERVSLVQEYYEQWQSLTRSDGRTEATVVEHEALQQADEALKAKAEKDYSASDWEKRARAAYVGKAYERAALYFQQAADASSDVLLDWARCTIGRGNALGAQGRNVEAEAVFDGVIARIGDTVEINLLAQVERALINKLVAAGRAGRHEEAIRMADDILQRFSDTAEPVLRGRVIVALYNKGVALRKLDRQEAAAAVFSQVVTRFDVVPENNLRSIVAKSLVSKGAALIRMGNNDAAVDAFDEVKTRFSAAPEPRLREQVASSMFAKGVALEHIGGAHGAARIVYEEIVKSFGADKGGAIKRIVARARTKLEEVDDSDEEQNSVEY